MTLDEAAFLEVLEAMKAAEVDDRFRTAAQNIYQALIDAELTNVIGAGPWERTAEWNAQRNGSRPRTLTTKAADLELRIPKLCTGSFFPSLLEWRPPPVDLARPNANLEGPHRPVNLLYPGMRVSASGGARRVVWWSFLRRRGR